MLRFAAAVLALSSSCVSALPADGDFTMAMASTTKIRPVDSGICLKGEVITISKCSRGTMISCEDGLEPSKFACDADGYPFRVMRMRTRGSATSAPKIERVQPSRAQSLAYHHRYGRGGRDGFFAFLHSVFKGRHER